MRERPEPARALRLIPPEWLAERVRVADFPDPAGADPDGLLAYGGDLHPERLLVAYALGIFPWYESPPILWYCPDPRTLIRADGLRINRSLARTLSRAPYRVTFDTRFREVIEACATVPRPGQSGTWIGRDMIEAYCALHELGFAHSIESWHGGQLVGGLYGISLGSAFFGESMFSLRSDASKVALVTLMRRIESWGFHFLDCQQPTPNTEKLGAIAVPREEFLLELARALEAPTRCGSWSVHDPNPEAAGPSATH